MRWKIVGLVVALVAILAIALVLIKMEYPGASPLRIVFRPVRLVARFLRGITSH